MATLEVTNSAGAVLATITHPLTVRTTDRASAIGEMACTLYVGSPGADSLAPGAYLRWTEGAYSFWGIVETLTRAEQEDGSAILNVTAADIARELVFSNAGAIQFVAGSSPISVQAALDKLLGYITVGAWTLTAGADLASDTIYFAADGASMWTAMLSMADKLGAYLVRGAGRTLTMTRTFTSSGVTARSVSGDRPANVAPLFTLQNALDGRETVAVIVPFTAGNAAVRVGLAQATAALPVGFLSTDSAYQLPDGIYQHWLGVENTAITGVFGHSKRVLQFPEISPLSNSGPDITTAANALQAAAVQYLRDHAAPRRVLQLVIDDAPVIVGPLQTLIVQHGDLNGPFRVMEATHTWTPNASIRSSLALNDSGGPAASGVGEAVRALEQARAYAAHAQLSANVYQMSYTKPVDAQYGAEFRFYFDSGITQVLMAALDVKMAPLESTVRAIGAAAVKTNAYTYAGHSHFLRLAAHQHFMGDHLHTYGIILPAHVHSIPLDAVNTGDTRHVYVDMTPVPKRLKVDSLPSAGTTVHSETVSTGSGAVGTGNTSTVGAAIATGTGLIVTSDNANYTAATAGGFTHDHTVDFAVTMEYGIFRDSSVNTFAAADLEYKINSGAWAALTGATALGDGWLRIPLTNAIVDAVTFTPLAKSNTVTLRAVVASAAEETYMVGGSPSGTFSRWNDAGVQQQQITGTAAQGLTLSPNGWLYLLRKSTGLVEVYAPNAAGTLALYDTWTLATNTFNAIAVDARTGGKWLAGDGGLVYGFGLGQKTLGGSPNLTAIAALGGNVFVTGGTQIHRVNTNVSGWPVTSVTPASGAGQPIAVLSDGRLVQVSANTAPFVLRVWAADLSASSNLTRSDAGNVWTPLSMAIAANLVHVGCSDGRVRTYSLDVAAGTAALVWTSTGTPGATGYPTATSLLGVAAVLSSKAAMIDAQLTVRSVVQAIVMN